MLQNQTIADRIDRTRPSWHQAEMLRCLADAPVYPMHTVERSGSCSLLSIKGDTTQWGFFFSNLVKLHRAEQVWQEVKFNENHKSWQISLPSDGPHLLLLLLVFSHKSPQTPSTLPALSSSPLLLTVSYFGWLTPSI